MKTRLAPILGTLALVAIFALAATMLVPAALGFHRYVIQTGSMTGTIDPGSLVYDKDTPVDQLRVGDIITFNPPPGYDAPAEVVTHRIYALGHDKRGRLTIRTKGDANQQPDLWTVTPNQATLPRVSFHVPELGRVFSALSSRTGHLLAFSIPGALIALSVLVGLWRDAGVEARERRAALTELNPEVQS